MAKGRQPRTNREINWVTDEDSNVLGYMKDSKTLIPITELTDEQRSNPNIIGAAGVGNGKIYDENGNEISADGRKALQFSQKKWKPGTNRVGWPTNRLTGQAIATVRAKNMAGDATSMKVLYVGAYGYREADASGGTIQTKVRNPITGAWGQMAFNGSLTGTIPTTGMKVLLSDEYPIDWKLGQEILLANSALNIIPCCEAGDWMVSSNSSREMFLQISSTTPQAMQMEYANDAQLDVLSMQPATRFMQSYTYNSTYLEIGVSGHGITSATNRRVICSATDNPAVNGVFSFSIAGGTNSIRITMADPGVINQLGVLQFAFAAGSLSWSGGYLTVGQTAHGRLPGEYLTFAGYSTTGASLNGKFEIFDCPTADTFRIAISDPGTITATNGYYYNAYTSSSGGATSYHLRPWAILLYHGTEVIGICGDSKSSVIDYATDYDMVQGIGERCVARDIIPAQMSAQNDGWNEWVAGIESHHAIRRYLLAEYCDTILDAECANDEGLYNAATASNWKAKRDELWALEPFATFAATGNNMAVIIPSGKTGSNDEYSTIEGQTTNLGALPYYHSLIRADLGVKYRYIFEYARLIEEYGLPGIYQVDPEARDLIVTTTAGSSLVTFDPSTPISRADNGKTLAIPGGGSTGNNYFYGRIRYRSPTIAVMVAGYSPRRPIAVTNALSGVTAKLGARLMISNTTSNIASIHESPYALRQIDTIGFKSPF